MSTPSSGLQIEDLTIGTGATAQAGQDVTVHYTGWLHDPTADQAVAGALTAASPAATPSSSAWVLAW